MLLTHSKKISIFNFRTVARRDITILPRHWKRFAARPIEQFLLRAFGGKNPQKFFGRLTLQLLEQMFQILETGNALTFSRRNNRQIRRKYGAPISLIFAPLAGVTSRRHSNL